MKNLLKFITSGQVELPKVLFLVGGHTAKERPASDCSYSGRI